MVYFAGFFSIVTKLIIVMIRDGLPKSDFSIGLKVRRVDKYTGDESGRASIWEISRSEGGDRVRSIVILIYAPVCDSRPGMISRGAVICPASDSVDERLIQTFVKPI